MRKPMYIHRYEVYRDAYSHFRVEHVETRKIGGRIKLMQAILRLFPNCSHFFYEISSSPRPKFPSIRTHF